MAYRFASGAMALLVASLSLGMLWACTVPPPPSRPSGHDGGAGGSDDGVGSSTQPTGPGGATPGPGGSGTPQPSGPPAIGYVGRFDTRDAAGPRIGWAGARVQVRFQGTSLNAKLAETPLYMGPSEYDVLIDDQLQPAPLAPNGGTADYVLATGLASGVHVVELRRRTEGQVGITQFLGFDYGGGSLLAPPVAPAHKIEFVGDSESAGYGLDCANGTESFSGATEDEPKAFPALIAEGLSAVRYNISYAGKGVLRNYDDEDTDTFAGIYTRALPDDTESSWTFASWVPDVVFIALGTNDYGNPDARDAPDADAFAAKYAELVALVREKNPSAHIICAVEGDLNDGYPGGWDAYTNVTNALKGVVAQRTAANDTKVHYYEFPRVDASGDNGEPDATACDEHPNVAWNRRGATDAIAKIKAIMSW